MDGVAPENYHSTSMFPEYFKIDGQWVLAAKSRMDASVVISDDGTVRPVFLYCVDAAEFAVNKLADRGSLSAVGIVTNVQDFITIIAKGLGTI